MTNDMKNLVISFAFFALMFITIGVGIGNRLRIENDIYLLPLVIFLGVGFLYSTSKFMKTQ